VWQVRKKWEGIMEYITSKNICLLTKDILELADRRITDHGLAVGYIVYRMLDASELFEEFEMAELSFIAVIHNIGGYRTDDIGELLKYGYRNYMPHSIYGYLFLKKLFPVSDYGKILLYHHMDYAQMEHVDYEFKFMSDYIHLADDVYTRRVESGNTFDYRSLQKYAGRKYSVKAYELLEKAVEEYQIFDRLDSGAYQDEMNRLMDFVLFRDDEKEKYLKMMMYCTGLLSSKVVTNTGICVCICEELAKRLGVSPAERHKLYLGALLHDIGMLQVPVEILQKPGKLTEEERRIMQQHVERAEQILRGRFKDQQVVDIAVRHHERLDGSGYPAKVKGSRMDRLDRILQVADTVCGIAGERAYHPARSKEEVLRILQDEVDRKHLDSNIVNQLSRSYNEIMECVKKESVRILVTYKQIEKQYEAARQRFC